MANATIRIGIIIGTTRPARFGAGRRNGFFVASPSAATPLSSSSTSATFRFRFSMRTNHPVHAPSGNQSARRWAETVSRLDGFVFVVGEYNHSISGALKNALDYLYYEFNRKAATFVAYGNAGGSRAVEHLRGILEELQVADIKHAVHIGPAEFRELRDGGKAFEGYPHLEAAASQALNELVWWAAALKAARENPDP